MPDFFGAILPGLLCLLLFVTGRARTSLTPGSVAVTVLTAAALTAALSRWHVDEERIALYLVPGATLLLLMQVRRGARMSPGFAFVVTYVSTLAVDVAMASMRLGSLADALPGIGGGGLLDGLLVLPALTAGAVAYAGRRMETAKIAPL